VAVDFDLLRVAARIAPVRLTHPSIFSLVGGSYDPPEQAVTVMPWWPPREVRRRQQAAEERTEPILDEIDRLARELQDAVRNLRMERAQAPRKDQP
jgi:hypothetical protein